MFSLVFAVVLGAAPSVGSVPMFYNIAPFSQGKESELARDMIEYVERTGNDTVLYSLSFHAEGRPALAKSERLLASYRKLRGELEGSKVRLGILLQSTLGHWPVVGDGHEKWQRTVTLTVPGLRYCPLDPRHRDFIRETVRLAAKEKPVLMMTDDDVTGFKHDDECFCPLHLAEFARRTGKRLTCDELRAVVREGKDVEMVNAFRQLQEDTVLGFAKLIRDAIDSVDPTIPGCACMPGGEPWRAGRTAKVMAAEGQPPMLRICNGQYSEFRGDDFSERVALTQVLSNMWKKDVPCLLDESDTFPHNLWSKSSRSFHAKLASSFFCGLKGGKLWFVNAHRGGCEISRNYTDILSEHRGYYAAVANAVEGASPLGVLLPASDDPARRPGWQDCCHGWVKEAFGIYGIPFNVEGDFSKDGVWALSGADLVTRRLTKDEIRKILSHRVLIDGPAAEALTELGFAELIGVRAEKGDLVFHNEEMDGLTVKLVPSDKAPVLKPLTGAKPITWLIRKDSVKGTEDRVAPGATVFRNSIGGRIVVTAWSSEVSVYNRRSEQRQIWVGKLLDELNETFAVRAVDHQDILALASRAKDGSTLVEIVNLCYDPLKTISLKVSGKVRKAEYLDNHGRWRPLDILSQQDGVIRLPLCVDMMEERILRLDMQIVEPMPAWQYRINWYEMNRDWGRTGMAGFVTPLGGINDFPELRPGHQQGHAVSDTHVFITTGSALAKLDFNGKVIKSVKAAGHLGDVAWYKGKVYVAWAYGGKLNPAIGKNAGAIAVFDEDLNELKRHELPDNPEVDGITIMDDVIYLGLDDHGRPLHRGDRIMRLDMDFNVIDIKNIDLGVEVNFGVQNLMNVNGKIWGFFYTQVWVNPGSNYSCAEFDKDLNLIRIYRCNAGQGVDLAPKRFQSFPGRTVVLRGHSSYPATDSSDDFVRFEYAFFTLPTGNE